uniref:Uncharacterized protein n=1 Tax=Clytia hemisphaerica TaxID=252671 RepID=A0A7M5VAS5_9CNID
MLSTIFRYLYHFRFWLIVIVWSMTLLNQGQTLPVNVYDELQPFSLFKTRENPFEKREKLTVDDTIKKEFKKLQDIRKLLMRMGGGSKISQQDSAFGSIGYWRGKRDELTESVPASVNPFSIWKRR